MSKVLEKISAIFLLILMLFSVSFNVLDYGYKVYAASIPSYDLTELKGEVKLALEYESGYYMSTPNLYELNIKSILEEDIIGRFIITDDTDTYKYIISSPNHLISIIDSGDNRTFNIKLNNNYKSDYYNGTKINYNITQWKKNILAPDEKTGTYSNSITLYDNVEDTDIESTFDEYTYTNGNEYHIQTGQYRFTKLGFGRITLKNIKGIVYEVSSDSDLITISKESDNSYKLIEMYQQKIELI